MAKRSDEHARQVLDAIRRIVRAIRVSSRQTERGVGLSTAQLFVLSKLAAGRAMSLNELADRTLTHQSSASVVVSKLVRRGLVQRATANDDRRRQELSLTAAGRELMNGSPRAAQEELVDGLLKLRAGELAQLAKLMTTFVRVAGLQERGPAPLMDDVVAKKRA